MSETVISCHMKTSGPIASSLASDVSQQDLNSTIFQTSDGLMLYVCVLECVLMEGHISPPVIMSYKSMVIAYQKAISRTSLSGDVYVAHAMQE